MTFLKKQFLCADGGSHSALQQVRRRGAITRSRNLAPGIGTAGFSLIEVTLSIGIIAFAFLAVLALLPLGLGLNKSSSESARALRVMNSLVMSIQSASGTSTGSNGGYAYKALAPFGGSSSSLKWNIPGGGSIPPVNFYLDDNDNPIPSKPAKMLAHVELTSPSDMASSGKAWIVVTWDQGVINSNTPWTSNPPPTSIATLLNQQKNYAETVIYFHPK